MRKTKQSNETNHIVSFRVSIEEKKMIDRWAKKNGMNTSSVLRAMFHYLQGSAEEAFSQYKESETIVTSG